MSGVLDEPLPNCFAGTGLPIKHRIMVHSILTERPSKKVLVDPTWLLGTSTAAEANTLL